MSGKGGKEEEEGGPKSDSRHSILDARHSTKSERRVNEPMNGKVRIILVVNADADRDGGEE
jgi:hypothetical protein